jgi:hypothetical protein
MYNTILEYGFTGIWYASGFTATRAIDDRVRFSNQLLNAHLATCCALAFIQTTPACLSSMSGFDATGSQPFIVG